MSVSKSDIYNKLALKLCTHKVKYTEPGRWCGPYGVRCGYYEFQGTRRCKKAMEIINALEEIGVDLGEW